MLNELEGSYGDKNDAQIKDGWVSNRVHTHGKPLPIPSFNIADEVEDLKKPKESERVTIKTDKPVRKKSCKRSVKQETIVLKDSEPSTTPIETIEPVEAFKLDDVSPNEREVRLDTKSSTNITPGNNEKQFFKPGTYF